MKEIIFKYVCYMGQYSFIANYDNEKINFKSYLRFYDGEKKNGGEITGVKVKRFSNLLNKIDFEQYESDCVTKDEENGDPQIVNIAHCDDDGHIYFAERDVLYGGDELKLIVKAIRICDKDDTWFNL